jgi:enamine deaminase RidA (YjgF/YER057c/UK114 family)
MHSPSDCLAAAQATCRKVFHHAGTEEWWSMANDLPAARAGLEALGCVPLRVVCYDAGECGPGLPGVPATALINSGAPRAVHVLGVRGATLQPLVLRGRRVGSWFAAGGLRRLHAGGLGADQAGAAPAAAAAVFEDMRAVLAQAGMNYADIARTWFHLDRILDWYGPFNEVRAAAFKDAGLRVGKLPASTGVGLPNAAGTALAADLLAVTGEGAELGEVDSPWQGPATAYGSLFSRALRIRTPEAGQFLVSGTAAIDPAGRTMHLGDANAQREATFEGVGALLGAGGFAWPDVTRAIAYAPDPAQTLAAAAELARLGVNPGTVACCVADICRSDLLFELEVEANR